MLTATTETAIRALIYLNLYGKGQPVSPREISAKVGGSPSYMAKITGYLTKAGIVRSVNGVAGGIVLNHKANEITLLQIIEACQGLLTADYCNALGAATSPEVCGFHKAMYEVHVATTKALSRWNLKMLAGQPTPVGSLEGNSECRMSSLVAGCNGCKSGPGDSPAPPGD